MLDSTYSSLTLLGTPQNAYEWVAGQTTNQKLRKLRKLYGDKIVQIEEGIFLLLQREVFINEDRNNSNIANVETIRKAAKPYLNTLGTGNNIMISIPIYAPERMQLCFEENVYNVLEERSIKILRSNNIPDCYYQHEGKIPITFTKHHRGFVGLIKKDLLRGYFGLDFKPYRVAYPAKTIIISKTDTELFTTDPIVTSNLIKSQVSSKKHSNLLQKQPMVTSSNANNFEPQVLLKNEVNPSQRKTIVTSNSIEPQTSSKKAAKQPPEKLKAKRSPKAVKSKQNSTTIFRENKRYKQVTIGWLLATLILAVVVWVWSPQDNSPSQIGQTQAALTYKHTANSSSPSDLELIDSNQDSHKNDVWEIVKRDFNGTTMVLVPAVNFSTVISSDTKQRDSDSALILCNETPSGRKCERLWYEEETSTNAQHFASSFWLDETEVTRSAYESCVSASVCTPALSNKLSTTANQPINRVTWYQATAYCKWREARLPTEAEWEYAARQPNRLGYPYEDINHKGDLAEIMSVGSYPVNKSWVGALDMSGNVWEWTNSLYKEYPHGKTDEMELNENAIGKQIVLRKGLFIDSSEAVRAANRYWASFDYGGFRCARSQDKDEANL